MATYTACVNRPGCLPEQDPQTFDDVLSAIDWLRTEREVQIDMWVESKPDIADPDAPYLDDDATYHALETWMDERPNQPGWLWGPTPGHDPSNPTDVGWNYSVYQTL